MMEESPRELAHDVVEKVHELREEDPLHLIIANISDTANATNV